MPRNLHADVVAELDKDDLKFIALIELVFDAVTVRMCNRLDSFAYNSDIYTGFGSIGSIGNIEESMDLDPTNCEITLSGIDSATLATIVNNEQLNRKIYIRYALIDGNNELIGEPILHFEGSMEPPQVLYGKTSSIEIKATDQLADWDREQSERLTYEDQIERYPNDTGLQYMAGLASKTIIWPSQGFRE